MKKFLKVIGSVILIIAIAIIAILFYLSKKPVVATNYNTTIKTSAELESKYFQTGSYEVSKLEIKADGTDAKQYKIFYPTDLSEAYPVVVMVNGTGVPASKYEPVFRHLASWGFIVIGNQDENSRTGQSSEESISYLLNCNEDESSIFYQKIDVDHIGIGGHSQGGVGTINAVTNQPHGYLYQAMYTASCTSRFFAREEGLGTDWMYDVSAIHIPYFMTAGTGTLDAGTAESFEATEGQGICPLWSMLENYEAIDSSVMKVMARRTDADHGDMLTYGDGYMTAWFMYFLQNDTEAGKVFFDEDAEILNNNLWLDIQINK